MATDYQIDVAMDAYAEASGQSVSRPWMVAAIEAFESTTPDAITDEMVERAQHKIQRRATRIPAETIRLALIAALTEPPARPEGAEQWEDFLIDSLDYQALTDQQIADLADRIARKEHQQ